MTIKNYAASKTMTVKQIDSLHERVKTIVDENKRASIELCMAVWETNTSMVNVDGEYKYCWETWGHKSWEDFLGKEMHLHLNTAYRLSKVWETFYVDLQGAWDLSLLLGITKMKLLTAAPLTQRNVESWLRKAAAMNCRQLRAAVHNTEELHQFATQLTGSQMNAIKRALEQAKSSYTRGEKMGRGELLVHIVRDWANANKPSLRNVA